jgi:hypothetical protein
VLLLNLLKVETSPEKEIERFYQRNWEKKRRLLRKRYAEKKGLVF